MTNETLPHAPTPERKSHLEQLTREELTEIGGLVIAAANRPDLEKVVEEHIELTSQVHTNMHRPDPFHLQPRENAIAQEVGKSYRSVDARGIYDLVDSGVVRGARTATGGQRSSTTGHSTYWSDATEGRHHNLASSTHLLIETPTKNLDKWVTAKDVSAIYGKDNEGNVHNILQLARDKAKESLTP